MNIIAKLNEQYLNFPILAVLLFMVAKRTQWYEYEYENEHKHEYRNDCANANVSVRINMEMYVIGTNFLLVGIAFFPYFKNSAVKTAKC